ncbi:MAG: tetratricopeptide repeat protein [Flavobacteriales bacterium]|nr:tetratricopeptide repeat protein [Flavobacteriales bacterium]
MKMLYTTIVILFCGASYSAQSHYDQFLKSFKEGDTTQTLNILEEWESESPEDPELFTSYFNYYFKKSQSSILSLSSQPHDGENLVAYSETDTFYMGDAVMYDEENLKLAFEKINKGIELYPNRLDMRFGKLYVFKTVGDWENFTTELKTTIQYSGKNKNQWTWTKNEPKEDGKDFFLSCIQSYQMDLYNTYNDDLLVNMREIAEEVIKIYPEHVESWSNIGITYILSEQFDKALDSFFQAEQLDPEDTIVLNNIAHCYRLKGDKKNSIKYYKKMKEYGDQDTKDYAQKMIDEINAEK